jgi:hypothetical protein
VSAALRAAVPVIAVLFTPIAFADVAADLAHCASVEAPDVRLACYDALARRPPAPLAAATSAAAAPIAAPIAAPAPTAPSVAPAPPVASAPARSENDAFGLSEAKLHPVAATGPDSIQAMVAGISFDQTGHAKVRLDNGQAWVVSETEANLKQGQPVTIRRAALGSYLLVTADRHSYRVRRTE